MRNYELTERGKIVIAVIIAVLLLVLSVILMINAFASPTSQLPGNQDAAAVDAPSPPPIETPVETPLEPSAETPIGPSVETLIEPPPEIPIEPPPEVPPKTTNSPPPNGGGFTPPDVSPPTVGSDPGEGDYLNGQENVFTPDSGPTGGNPSEGTLSFLFSPNYQNGLDSETASLLGDLLNSQNNTRNSTIAVATARLTDSASAALMAAVVDAFDIYGIPAQRIIHIENSTGSAGETFEVSFYFIPASGK